MNELQNALKIQGLKVYNVPGNGNFLSEAIAHQFRCQGYHKTGQEVKAALLKYLADNSSVSFYTTVSRCTMYNL